MMSLQTSDTLKYENGSIEEYIVNTDLFFINGTPELYLFPLSRRISVIILTCLSQLTDERLHMDEEHSSAVGLSGECPDQSGQCYVSLETF